MIYQSFLPYRGLKSNGMETYAKRNHNPLLIYSFIRKEPASFFKSPSASS